ncbi:MAG: FadR/GntR family transcriptional regulator [Allobranchiibius sp.]
MTGIEPIARPVSLPVRIAQQILELIEDGTFEVGGKLPSEMELARRFGVSRPSVREALGALQFAGHVESVRGSGTRVTRSHGSLVGGADVAVEMTANMALDLFEARLLLEPQVAALAAQNPVVDKIDDAAELIEGMHLVVQQPGVHAETDLRIHLALAEICPNALMRARVLQLIDLAGSPALESVRSQAWDEKLLPPIWGDQHQDVLDAIVARDPEAAAQATWVHLVSAALSACDVLATDPGIDPTALLRVRTLAQNGPTRSTLATQHTSGPLIVSVDVGEPR